MKRILTLSAIALLLASCNGNQEGENYPSPVPEDKVELKASIGEPGTRTSMDGLNVNWAENDDLFVCSSTHFDGYHFQLSSGTGTKFATFYRNPEKDLIPGKFLDENDPEPEFIAFHPARAVKMSGSKDNEGKSGLWYPLITLPSEQHYVAGGVEDGLLFMRSKGKDLENMNFKHMTGIIRIQLYDPEPEGKPIKITGAEFTTPGAVTCGAFYYDFINYTKKTGLTTIRSFGPVASNQDNVRLKLRCQTPVTLSKNPEIPTAFNFVLPAELELKSGFTAIFYTEDNLVMTLTKGIENDIPLVKAATVTTYPSKPFRNDISQNNEEVRITVNGKEDSFKGTIPTPDQNSVLKIRTLGQTRLTRAVLEQANMAVYLSKGEIELDFSGSTYHEEEFPSLFKGNTKIRSIKFPKVKRLARHVLESTPNCTAVTLPEGLETIGMYAFMFTPVKTVHIPSSVKTIEWMMVRSDATESITVDPHNSTYASLDGVLYRKNKDGVADVLLLYPGGKPDKTFEIKEGIVRTEQYSFLEARKLEELIMPSSLLQADGLQNVPMLHKITCRNTKPTFLKVPEDWEGLGCDASTAGKRVINVPTGCKEAYLQIEGWNYVATKWKFIIVDGTETHGASAEITPLPEHKDQGGWK